ncbi:MAG TPA: AAC(3) family N-acetyltransferase [Solirubrobacteraceae bacterium]|nr:AAC(3) family N-acetyltransferase [Solirubrobacteraceae bacterium]
MRRVSGEERSIRASPAPVTREGLAADLGRLGVRPGGVLLVHSSLSSLGWVCGGAQAVVEALLDALGPDGTLVVPTHTTGNSDPSSWQAPPVPEDWWPVIRATMPPYDPVITPARGLGVVTELARTWPGARRSAHPQDSFAAIGPHADEVTAGHTPASGFGERSPLARIHDLDGDVLLLGVGHGSNTSLHLAEHRVPDPRREAYGAAVMGPDGRRWATWEDVVADETDFERLGAAFDATGATRVGSVGAGAARLMRQRELVAFAVAWMVEHRA